MPIASARRDQCSADPGILCHIRAGSVAHVDHGVLRFDRLSLHQWRQAAGTATKLVGEDDEPKYAPSAPSSSAAISQINGLQEGADAERSPRNAAKGAPVTESTKIQCFLMTTKPSPGLLSLN